MQPIESGVSIGIAPAPAPHVPARTAVQRPEVATGLPLPVLVRQQDAHRALTPEFVAPAPTSAVGPIFKLDPRGRQVQGLGR